MLRERGKRCTGGGNANEERRVERKKGKDGERRGGSKKHVGERGERYATVMRLTSMARRPEVRSRKCKIQRPF